MKQRTEDVFEPVTSVEVPQGFEEFIAPHVESMRQEIRKRLVESDPDYPDEEYEEDAENALRVEVGFCQQVAAAYERWSQENEPLVLWDVDETLGMHTHTDEGYIFRFRPSLFFLVAHLQQNFPDVRNGILSNRTKLADQLADPKYLEGIADFIDAEHLYSSRDVEVAEDVNTLLEGRVGGADSDHRQKLTVIKQLEGAGVNVKVIDDNKVAETMGEDGVCTYNLMPRV